MHVEANGQIFAPKERLDQESVEVFPGAWGSFTNSGDITIARWSLAPGTVIPPHQHEEEQFVCMLEGVFKMTVGNSTFELSAGDNLYIPRNALHSGTTVTTVRCIDVFNPPRDDYRFFE